MTPPIRMVSVPVALPLKLIDTLKPLAIVAEKLKHCHVMEVCEPTADNPSRTTIPMPREWFERTADDLEAIAILMHGAGVLSEGQAATLTGLDRVEVRKQVDALTAAPVREEGGAGMELIEAAKECLRLGRSTGEDTPENRKRARAQYRLNQLTTPANIIAAVRAQPQAREEAQPVAWCDPDVIEHLFETRQPIVAGFFPTRSNDAGATTALYTTPPAPEAEKIADDVRRLVIAARNVAFDNPTQAELRALDIASEAFASRVPWEDEPEALAALQQEVRPDA